MASLISIIPWSLRSFTYIGDWERPWIDLLPAPDLIPSGIDSLASNQFERSEHLSPGIQGGKYYHST